MVYFCTNSERF